MEVLPAVHTVPAVGYAVATGKGCWVFTGDTEQNPALWARINQMNVAMNLRAVYGAASYLQAKSAFIRLRDERYPQLSSVKLP